MMYLSRSCTLKRGGKCAFSTAIKAKDAELLGKTLTNLDLNSENKGNFGVFDGSWKGQTSLNKSMYNPTTNERIGDVLFGNVEDYETVVKSMDNVKESWMNVPAPQRGEVVRIIGESLREYKHDLGALVSFEMGKIYSEGLGEVQEAIDICDYAVGLSRMLNGSVIPSERPGHLMLERYNPLKGHVGIISAFNFPVAVYFWNLALSLVAGNTSLWKPAPSTSLVSVAVTKIVANALEKAGQSPAIASMICGDGDNVGQTLVSDPRMELVSFTGSTRAGRHVAKVVAGRFGKSILELGGNNCQIVDKSADISMAVRATLFGAVGTAGQRCTTLRRLVLHTDIYNDFIDRLVKGYQSVKIGSPLQSDTLCGPLHNSVAVDAYFAVIEEAKSQGGRVICGGTVATDITESLGGNFVTPTVIEFDNISSVMLQEVFVPVLYVVRWNGCVHDAIAINNSVPQGLSSSLFSNDIGQIFEWTGQHGSDCGIVNVNIGTSGAEIGGAFGGEKETGGGRESGSDAWKQYMRRSTCTVNHSKELPLAQGVNFGD